MKFGQAAVIGQYVKFIAAAEGNWEEAAARAHKIYGPHARVTELLVKQSTGTPDLGNDPDFNTAAADFLSLVRIRSIVGKINAVTPFRKAPVNTKILRQTARPIATWVAEGQAAKASKFQFEQFTYRSKKLAALSVFTEDLVRKVGAEFENAMVQDLVWPIAHLESESFIDPSNAGIEDKMPASVTHGITPLVSTGNPREDVEQMVEAFEGDLETAVLIMRPNLAVKAGGYFNDTVGARGGEAGGIPVVTSGSIPNDSNGTHITLLDPTGICLVDEGISFRFSKSGSIQIDDDDVGDGFYSLFQSNLVGAICSRHMNWEIARPGSVLTLAANWGAS